LAEKYDFSGGQIENVARHYAIDTVLYGDSASSLEKLMAHCDSERLEQQVEPVPQCGAGLSHFLGHTRRQAGVVQHQLDVGSKAVATCEVFDACQQIGGRLLSVDA